MLPEMSKKYGQHREVFYVKMISLALFGDVGGKVERKMNIIAKTAVKVDK